jgi:hypothetical protein
MTGGRGVSPGTAGRRPALGRWDGRAFYEGLAAAGLDFATPRILEIWEVGGVQVTVAALLGT